MSMDDYVSKSDLGTLAYLVALIIVLGFTIATVKVLADRDEEAEQKK